MVESKEEAEYSTKESTETDKIVQSISSFEDKKSPLNAKDLDIPQKKIESPQSQTKKNKNGGRFLLTNSQKVERLKREAEEEQTTLILNHKATSLSNLRRIRYLEHQISRIQEKVEEIRMEVKDFKDFLSLFVLKVRIPPFHHNFYIYDEDNQSISMTFQNSYKLTKNVSQTLELEERTKRDLAYYKVRILLLFIVEREYKIVFSLVEVTMPRELQKAYKLLEESHLNCKALINNRVQCRKKLQIATQNISNMRKKAQHEESIFKKDQIRYMKSVTCFDYDWKEIKIKNFINVI